MSTQEFIKKIAIVMPWHPSEKTGGAEIQAWFLATELSKRNYKVSYICQTNFRNKESKTEYNNGVIIHWLEPSRRFFVLDQNKYYCALLNEMPDIIVQRTTSNITGIVGRFTTKYNKLFIWIATDNDAPQKYYHLKRFFDRYSLKNYSFYRYIFLLLNAIFEDYFRIKGMKHVDIAFTQNNIQKNLLYKNFNLTSETIISGHPLPNQEIPVKQRFNKKKILWIGNLGLHKRPQKYIELAEIISDENIQFILIGDHPKDSYKKDLLQNLSPNINYLGKLPFEQTAVWFDETSLLINTSISEGFSNTFIQAWMRGIPVLTLGVDPNNIIRNKNLGFVSSNLIELKNKIEQLLGNFDEYRNLSDNCKNYAQDNHTLEKMTNRFIKIINEVNQS